MVYRERDRSDPLPVPKGLELVNEEYGVTMWLSNSLRGAQSFPSSTRREKLVAALTELLEGPAIPLPSELMTTISKVETKYSELEKELASLKADYRKLQSTKAEEYDIYLASLEHSAEADLKHKRSMYLFERKMKVALWILVITGLFIYFKYYY